MAVLKVLAVNAGPAAPDIDGVIALEWNVSKGSFHGTGDATIATHAGLLGFVTGAVTVEDWTTADSVTALAIAATAAFTVLDSAGNVTTTVTFSQFCATGNDITVGDGLAVGAPVPGLRVPFEATAVNCAVAG